MEHLIQGHLTIRRLRSDNIWFLFPSTWFSDREGSAGCHRNSWWQCQSSSILTRRFVDIYDLNFIQNNIVSTSTDDSFITYVQYDRRSSFFKFSIHCKTCYCKFYIVTKHNFSQWKTWLISVYIGLEFLPISTGGF